MVSGHFSPKKGNDLLQNWEFSRELYYTAMITFHGNREIGDNYEKNKYSLNYYYCLSVLAAIPSSLLRTAVQTKYFHL